MSRYWSDVVAKLTPYVPGEQPQHDRLVKLNTNESPYEPSPQVLRAIAATPADSLRLYPDPESVALKQAFASRNSLRALLKHLEGVSDADIAEVNIPTGAPRRYTFDDRLQVVSADYLGDADAVAAAAAAVAAQAGTAH